jgi:hypothetical protein
MVESITIAVNAVSEVVLVMAHLIQDLSIGQAGYPS